MKNINERCPLSTECERRKCDYKFKEFECSYYSANARPGEGIEGVEVVQDILDSFDIAEDERQLQYIDIELIHNHPDNPRKDVGDVTELAESIKQQGVMQNLTVVPYEGEYRVIIGHRRLAASKMAGLKEVPCVVVEMSEREQLGVMLSENMQRVDLTPIEEALGVQMLLDLGDSIKDISRLTGFSESKVRQRAKMSQLPRKDFLASQGGSIQDYIKITEIEDEGKRKVLLKKLGTADFNLEYNRAAAAQKSAQEKQHWLDLFDSFAEKTQSSADKKYIRTVWMGSEKPENFAVPDDADDVRYYYEDMISYIRLSRAYTREEKEENQQIAKENAQMQVKRDLKINRFKNLENEFARLRCEFATDYKGDKSHAYHLTEYLIHYLVEHINDYFSSPFERKKYCELLNIMGLFKLETDYDVLCKSDEYRRTLCKQPQRLLLCFVVTLMENVIDDTWDWALRYRADETRDAYFNILKQCGYVMAEEEKKFYDGTHELYEKDGEDNE